MTTNNDLQHLKSSRRLTLAITSTISGTRGPLTVKQAAKQYPAEFAALLAEMQAAVRKQMELEL
jgi:hypothetical protein